MLRHPCRSAGVPRCLYRAGMAACGGSWMRRLIEQAPVSGLTIGHKQGSSGEAEGLSMSAELPEDLQEVWNPMPKLHQQCQRPSASS